MCSNSMSTSEIFSTNFEEEHSSTAVLNEHVVVDSHDDWYEDDLQLAAELGKTLLERNKELEGSLRQQQLVIEDQAQVIEYLSKQTTALREVNDSRLKIYEQLENNIQELENSNQRLQHESNSDKKKIKSLQSTLDNLEKRCEELEALEEELKILKQQKKLDKKRERRRTMGYLESHTLQKAFGMENGQFLSRNGSQQLTDDSPELEIKFLHKTMRELRNEKNHEQKRREELEIEVSCLLRDNENLSDEVASLHRREAALKALESDLQSLEEFSSQNGNICRYCHHQLNSERMTMLLNNGVEEECAPSIGICSLATLKNGVLAYGSQESLLSLGATVFDKPQCPRSQEAEVLKETTLLNELDTQYRNLIEKYESLIGVQKQPGDMDSDDHDGSRNLNSVDSLTSESSKAEASSLSSGFSSDGDVAFANKSVQTDLVMLEKPASKKSQKGKIANPVDKHFNHGSPEYKKLFRDIFAVLKTPVQWDQRCKSVEEPAPATVQREVSPPATLPMKEKPKATVGFVEQKKEDSPKGFKNYNVSFPLAPRHRQAGASTAAVALLRRTYAEVVISGDREKQKASVKSKSRKMDF